MPVAVGGFVNCWLFIETRRGQSGKVRCSNDMFGCRKRRRMVIKESRNSTRSLSDEWFPVLKEEQVSCTESRSWLAGEEVYWC